MEAEMKYFAIVVLLLLAAVALFMTYRAKFVLKKFLKREEPDEKEVLRVKLAALMIGVVVFILAITCL